MGFLFPRVYPILDASTIPAAGRAEFLFRLGSELARAGVTLLEYRNKTGTEEEILTDARILRRVLPAPNIKLILNDRADLVEQTGFDGTHVDAGDVTPREARRILGRERIVGTFGGPVEKDGGLAPGILEEPVDYLAIGPVFATQTKQTSKAPIGVEGVRRMRALAGPERILTAAGGITLASAAEVLEAGASSVAVSAALFHAVDPAAEFQRWMARLA
ncbi:MAG TPA: thiamine phosphate synthase [Terracidiphilus sp.]|nr:thiamine phosphate synthase [Terracidiphilus sp.]